MKRTYRIIAAICCILLSLCVGAAAEHIPPCAAAGEVLCSQYEVTAKTLSGKLNNSGKTVLEYDIQYPQIQWMEQSSVCSCFTTLNAFYQEKAERYEAYVKATLYPEAVEQMKSLEQSGFPFKMYQSVVRFVIGTKSEILLSIYSDTYTYTGGAHGNTVRESESWNMQSCSKLTLAELYPGQEDYARQLKTDIKSRIAAQPGIFFKEENIVEDGFDPAQFYIKNNELVIYFQLYTIAPYAAGIVEFNFPLPQR